MPTSETLEIPGFRIGETGEVIIGQNERMRALFSFARAIAGSKENVLITGETGTGKELFAKALHYLDGTKGRFVPVDCAGIPSEILESILFGHVRGAFTGAIRDSGGLVKAAEEGTLFLDEIGDMDPRLQAKILRVIQERQITPVGSSEVKEVDVRIVAATNQDLLKAMEGGKFRRDLYYRLSTFVMPVPPLRERKDDLSYLTGHFIDRLNGSKGLHLEGLTEEALERLGDYDWPGNVRELNAVLIRSGVLKKQGVLDSRDLSLVPADVFHILKHKSRQAVSAAAPMAPLAPPASSPGKPKEEPAPPEEVKPKIPDRYTRGVLPMTVPQISGLEGAKINLTLNKIVTKDQDIYCIVPTSREEGVSTRGQRRVVFVDHHALDRLFRDRTTEAYVALERRLADNPFFELLKTGEPFLVTDSGAVREIPGVPKSVKTLQDCIKEAGERFYHIAEGGPKKATYLVVPLSAAKYLVSEIPNSTRAERIRSLREYIISWHQKEFLARHNLVPNPSQTPDLPASHVAPTAPPVSEKTTPPTPRREGEEERLAAADAIKAAKREEFLRQGEELIGRPITLERAPRGLWYAHGVMPIFAQQLATMEKAREYQNLLTLQEQGRLYGVQVSSDRCNNHWVLFLNPELAALAFVNGESEAYRRLLGRIKDNGMNGIVSQPFMLTSRLTLLPSLTRGDSAEALDRALSSTQPYTLSPTDYEVFVLSQTNLASIRIRHRLKPDTVDRIETLMNAQYKAFKSWKPSQLKD
jgi:hypothetical protein